MEANLRTWTLTTLRIKVVRYRMDCMLTTGRRLRSKSRTKQRGRRWGSTRKRWHLISFSIKGTNRPRKVKSPLWYRFSSCLWRSWFMRSKMTQSQTYRRHSRSITMLVSYSQTRFYFNLKRNLCSVKHSFFFRSIYTKPYSGSSSSYPSISLKSLSQFLTYSCLLFSIQMPVTMQNVTCLKKNLLRPIVTSWKRRVTCWWTSLV